MSHFLTLTHPTPQPPPFPTTLTLTPTTTNPLLQAAAPEPSPEPTPSTLAEGWTKGYFVTPDLECEGGSSLRCVNAEAVWRISGAKPGNGVDCILDDNVSARVFVSFGE